MLRGGSRRRKLQGIPNLTSKSKAGHEEAVGRALGYDWDKEDSIQDALEHGSELKLAAGEIRDGALQHKVEGDLELADVMLEKAAVLEETAELRVQKAQLVGERNDLRLQQVAMVEEIDGGRKLAKKLLKIEKDVLKIMGEMTLMGHDMKELKEAAKESEKFMKQRLKYEKVWQKAIDALGVTEDELKSVGKVEQALNRVVKWFTNSYGCELGVVITRLS